MNPAIVHKLKQFIKFFDRIPDSKWCTGLYHSSGNKQHCAVGHLIAVGKPAEADLLTDLLESFEPSCGSAVLPRINDGKTIFRDWGKTPKERILTALNKRLEMEINNSYAPSHNTPDQALS